MTIFVANFVIMPGKVIWEKINAPPFAGESIQGIQQWISCLQVVGRGMI